MEDDLHEVRMQRLNDRVNGVLISAMTRQSGFSLIEALVVMVFTICVVLIPLSWWTDRSLEYVLSEMKERPVEVHGGLSFLVTLLAPLALLFNIVVEIYRNA